MISYIRGKVIDQRLVHIVPMGFQMRGICKSPLKKEVPVIKEVVIGDGWVQINPFNVGVYKRSGIFPDGTSQVWDIRPDKNQMANLDVEKINPEDSKYIIVLRDGIPIGYLSNDRLSIIVEPFGIEWRI